MKKIAVSLIMVIIFFLTAVPVAFSFWGGKFETLKPVDGMLKINVKDISDGKAHYFKAKADDGIWVYFFTLKSRDGVIRAAIDACDVCYRAGKGYIQAGDFMVCENCGQRFVSNRINLVKGGCNPAPLNRALDGRHLVIQMADINQNSWYCQYKS